MSAQSLAHPLIILAAGRSSRLGEPKGLVDVGGRSWIERQLAAFAASGGERVAIVLGHSRDAYLARLPWIADAIAGDIVVENLRTSVLVNDDPDRGPFSSLQVGARALLADANVRASYILPVDVPSPRPNVWAALASGLAGNVDAAIPVFEGRGGHPVLCAASLLRDVVATSCERADARLDAKLRAAPNVVRVAVDDRRVVMNMNTPEDWAALSDG